MTTFLKFFEWRPLWKAGVAQYSDAAEAGELDPIRCDSHYREALALCRAISECASAEELAATIRGSHETARKLGGFLLMIDECLEEGIGCEWTFDLPAAGLPLDPPPFLIFAAVASLGLRSMMP